MPVLGISTSSLENVWTFGTIASGVGGDATKPGHLRLTHHQSSVLLFMKSAAKYSLTLLAFIFASFGLSWLAVYSFWFTARLFHSVAAVRIGEALGSVVLAPVRVLFWLMGDFVDQSTPLYDPTAYATINAALLGILAYSCCRSWLFERTPGGNA